MSDIHVAPERLENIAAIRRIADHEALLQGNYVESDYRRLADSLIRLGLKIRIDHTSVEHLILIEKEVKEHDVD